MHFDAESNLTFAQAMAEMVRRIFDVQEQMENTWN